MLEGLEWVCCIVWKKKLVRGDIFLRIPSSLPSSLYLLLIHIHILFHYLLLTLSTISIVSSKHPLFIIQFYLVWGMRGCLPLESWVSPLLSLSQRSIFDRPKGSVRTSTNISLCIYPSLNSKISYLLTTRKIGGS